MGDVLICDQVCVPVVPTSGRFSCDKRQSFLLAETPGERTCDNGVLIGGSVFRQTRGIPRKPFPTFAVFQVPLALRHQYTKAARFGMA